MMTNLSFIHRFEPATRLEAPPLLLLHGTGGDENDLLQLGRMIAPGSALLSPRGKVLEHGMPRFFRRHAEGVFDEDDLRTRANELADFVEEARKAYGIERPIAVGFSNGANIAAATMLLRPGVLAGAALLRAMVPLSQAPDADLTGTPVLILSGQNDPIVPREIARQLHALLCERGADVAFHARPIGHQLTQTDLTITRQWLGALDRKPLARAS